VILPEIKILPFPQECFSTSAHRNLGFAKVWSVTFRSSGRLPDCRLDNGGDLAEEVVEVGRCEGSNETDADAFLEFIEPVLEAGERFQAVGGAVGEVGAGAVSLDEAQVPQIRAGSRSAVQIV